jgi:hypothetical protein
MTIPLSTIPRSLESHNYVNLYVEQERKKGGNKRQLCYHQDKINYIFCQHI